MQTLELRDKNVVVLGLGRSGMAAASLLQRDGAHVVVRDEAYGAVMEERANQLRQLGVRVELGGTAFDFDREFDFAVISPGIGSERPLVRELLARQTPVMSELELAYRHCLCPIVAVTGTNGKTTTTELIAAVLVESGKRAVAAGNNGHAFSDSVVGSAGLDSLVLEASSFQLEKISQFRPAIAVLLNIRPDHLDRHRSMNDYARAKARIFMNQNANDTLVVSEEALQQLTELGLVPPSRIISFSALNHGGSLWLDWADGDSIWCNLPECRGVLMRLSETTLRGSHNAENIMAALATGLAMGLPVRLMREAILGYCPQPHRCEFVVQRDGVTFINDSKATNPDAVARALRAQSGPSILIAGGRNKGLDFSLIRQVISDHVKLAIVLGESQDKICRAWKGAAPCARVSSLPEAVQLAASRARTGDTVLLSPGCTSFDMFGSYEERGDEFKRLVFDLV